MSYTEAADIVPFALIVGVLSAACSVFFFAWKYLTAAHACANFDLHGEHDGGCPEKTADSSECGLPGADDGRGEVASFRIPDVAAQPIGDFQPFGPTGRRHPAILPCSSTEIEGSMSLTSQWAKGQITTDDLITRGAADLYKGFQFFAHLPFAQTVVDWTVAGIEAFIFKTTGSTLIAVNIADAIKVEFAKLAGLPAPIVQPGPLQPIANPQ